MSNPNQWPIFAAVDDSEQTLLACPFCGDGLMRNTESRITRSAVRIGFVCTVCETTAECVMECHRDRTHITWEWSR